jgi:O-acetyl-ADP-ribose deacetylase (regulator of RNase III)
MEFKIINTNIVNVSADAIVLPANPALKEGRGASTAIFQAAGRRELTIACKRIGHCDVGNAVPTKAFHLNAKYIIHAVVPKWEDGNHNENNLLCKAYLSALYIADIMGCRQIAFPLLASGNNGFDKRLALEIAVKSISQFEGNYLQRAYLVVYGDTVTTLCDQLGYHVLMIPEKTVETVHDAKMNALFEEGKNVMKDFAENQLQKGINWLNNPENQEKIVNSAIDIVKKAYRASRK